MKDASHLAIVAWTENKRKPDQSILDSFEVQKIEEKGKGTFVNDVTVKVHLVIWISHKCCFLSFCLVLIYLHLS